MGTYAEDPHAQWAIEGLPEDPPCSCNGNCWDFIRCDLDDSIGICARATNWKKHLVEWVEYCDDDEEDTCIFH